MTHLTAGADLQACECQSKSWNGAEMLEDMRKGSWGVSHDPAFRAMWACSLPVEPPIA